MATATFVVMKELGRRIKSRRVKLSLTQGDLASRVGRKHPWLSALEKGSGNPSAEIITALAVELGEDPADYLRLAGRTILRAEGVVPSNLDPRISAAIDDAVGRAMDRMADRLIEFLDQRLPRNENGAVS